MSGASRAPPPGSGPLREDGLIDLLIEAAPVAVAVYDAAGLRIRANQRATELLGSRDARHGESAVAGVVREVLVQGRAVAADEVVASEDGDAVVSWHGHAVRRGDAVVGVLLIGDDETRTARLEELAMTDPLTGVLNHGAFRDRLGAEVELAFRYGTPLGLALLDVDEFKVVNDTFGHQVGDRVLVDVIAIVTEHVRLSDVVARVGGDEFAILMPHADAHGSAVIAERVHAEVGAATVAAGHRVTLSIGVCELDEGEGPEDLVGRADRALYASKAQGRDRVSRFDRRHDVLQEALKELGAASPLARGQAAAAVRALARAIDLKDGATRQHSDRVAELTARLAETIGWPPERCELMRQAAVVHDVGKVAVPDSILLKPDRLTEAEYEVVRAHSDLGAQIAAEILTDEQTAWLRAHHERVDGSGYPDGLAGDEIPDGARILAVTDAYDVMVSDRPYAEGRDPTEALEELRRCAGTQFAPEVVEAFHTRRFVRLATIHSNQERSRAANGSPAFAADDRLDLRCECGDAACTAHILVSPQELEVARSHQRRFVLADGHEIPEVERVVGRTPRFIIVEKRI